MGIIPAARFMPDVRDLSFRTLSQFVIDRALSEWRFFVAAQRHLELSISLPISFLQDPASLEYLSRQLPDHPAFEGLIIEIDDGEITRDLSLARTFAKQARLQKIAIAIDRLGNEWGGSRPNAGFSVC
jgi:EAL domain-containing protein (putative c-di-GMP-specific phosphodiesterase class I)